MTHAQHTVVVDDPIAAVYAYLADGTNDAAWRPDLITINHKQVRAEVANLDDLATAMRG